MESFENNEYTFQVDKVLQVNRQVVIKSDDNDAEHLPCLSNKSRHTKAVTLLPT